jgi:hypothetical protein
VPNFSNAHGELPVANTAQPTYVPIDRDIHSKKRPSASGGKQKFGYEDYPSASRREVK